MNNEIYLALQNILETGWGLRLVNDYKGLPVVYASTLLDLKPECAIFSVHKHQAVCLSLERFTFLQSEVLPFVIRAEVVSVSIKDGIAVLHNFLFAQDSIGARTEIRVQPEQSVEVTIATKMRRIKGLLADLSIIGVGVYALSAYIYNPVSFNQGATVTIGVVEEPGPLEMSGTIQYVKRDGDTYRLGVNTHPERSAREKIAGFIAERQERLLNELEVLYQVQSTN